jgi:hypothetical protein
MPDLAKNRAVLPSNQPVSNDQPMKITANRAPLPTDPIGSGLAEFLEIRNQLRSLGKRPG